MGLQTSLHATELLMLMYWPCYLFGDLYFQIFDAVD